MEKTRAGLVSRIEDVISGRKQIDADLLDELEYTLISADIGVTTTREILERIRERVDRKLVGDASELRDLIANICWKCCSRATARSRMWTNRRLLSW